MTLEQCIAKYTTVPGVPNTGLASESTQHLLVYALAIGLTIFAIGIIFWKYSTRHSTKNSKLSNSLNRTSPKTPLLALALVGSLAAGFATISQQVSADSIPAECEQYVSQGDSGSDTGNTGNNNTDDNDGDNSDGDNGNTDNNTIVSGASIQSITTDQCQALPVYDSTNPEAIRTVTDSRGGTTQTYEIAKLADNNCWMLANLKLGSTTGTTTLTPADSDVASNFTLPRLYGGTEWGDETDTWDATYRSADPADTDDHYSYDYPRAYGPVTGDTGTGETNYGYLYNWSAVTAGESTTSHDETAGDASNSICPAGWRLPRSGYADTSNWPSYQGPFATNDFANLDIAFGGTGTVAYNGEANIAKWQYTGPFKGVFSGSWYGGFNGQSSYGLLWSSSANPGHYSYAFNASFGPDYVTPGDKDSWRDSGFGVRCLLN